LTEAQVKEIRAAYIPYKVTPKMLAEKYGVYYITISNVISRRTWKHVR
jgi:hypothetical protein